MMMSPDVDYDIDFAEGAEANSADNSEQASIHILQIKKLLRDSGEFFIEFFLGESIDFPVPGLHKDIWKLLTNTALARVLLAVPRDHAKTTLAKLCVIWYWLFTTHRFAVYLSNTNARAKDACRDIMNFIRCDNFRQVYGDVIMHKESETESIWIFDLPLGNGKYKRCILRAAGQGQSMRGINVDNQRPDMAVIDDVEDEDNTASEGLQKKLDRWMFGTFLKALARNRKILWLGNMLSKTSLLARLSKRPAWNPVVFGCLVRNNETGHIESLWPDRWSLEDLIQDFNEYRELGLMETWMCEMMNMPGHGENGFTAEQIFYRPIPNPDDIQAAWLCLDPAFGEKEANDDSSITVHVLPNDGPAIIVNEITGKMTEQEIFDHMLRLGQYWNAWVWGIEAVAAQRVLITLFRVFLTTKGMGHLVEFIPLVAGKAKNARISAFASAMAKKDYAVAEGLINFTTQFLAFDLSKTKQRDDLLDSSAYGPQMLAEYLPLLLNQFLGRQRVSTPARYGRSVASV